MYPIQQNYLRLNSRNENTMLTSDIIVYIVFPWPFMQQRERAYTNWLFSISSKLILSFFFFLQDRIGQDLIGNNSILHSTPSILHPTSGIFHPAYNILHQASYIQHPTSYIQHPTSYIKHPTSYPFSKSVKVFSLRTVRIHLAVTWDYWTFIHWESCRSHTLSLDFRD